MSAELLYSKDHEWVRVESDGTAIVGVTDFAAEQLGDVDAICVPGGFGIRGVDGKVGALRYAREQQIPALGLCLGMQCMVIEAARNMAGIEQATSSEF